MSLFYFITQIVTLAEQSGKCVPSPDRMGNFELCLPLNDKACTETEGCMFRPEADLYSRCSTCDNYVDPMCEIDCPRSLSPPEMDSATGICTGSPGFESLNEHCASMNNKFMECTDFIGCIFRFEQASSDERCKKCETEYDWMCDIDCPEEADAETSVCFHAPGYENMKDQCNEINDSVECRLVDGCVSRPPKASTYSRCSTCDNYVDPMCMIDCPH